MCVWLSTEPIFAVFAAGDEMKDLNGPIVSFDCCQPKHFVFLHVILSSDFNLRVRVVEPQLNNGASAYGCGSTKADDFLFCFLLINNQKVFDR